MHTSLIAILIISFVCQPILLNGQKFPVEIARMARLSPSKPTVNSARPDKGRPSSLATLISGSGNNDKSDTMQTFSPFPSHLSVTLPPETDFATTIQPAEPSSKAESASKDLSVPLTLNEKTDYLSLMTGTLENVTIVDEYQTPTTVAPPEPKATTTTSTIKLTLTVEELASPDDSSASTDAISSHQDEQPVRVSSYSLLSLPDIKFVTVKHIGLTEDSSQSSGEQLRFLTTQMPPPLVGDNQEPELTVDSETNRVLASTQSFADQPAPGEGRGGSSCNYITNVNSESSAPAPALVTTALLQLGLILPISLLLLQFQTNLY